MLLRGFKFAEIEMSTFSCSLQHTDLIMSPPAEIVLSTLLKTFIFELSDKDIVWRSGAFVTPATKGMEEETSHLPLIVSLAKTASVM
jgi:hypothetical protein